MENIISLFLVTSNKVLLSSRCLKVPFTLVPAYINFSSAVKREHTTFEFIFEMACVFQLPSNNKFRLRLTEVSALRRCPPYGGVRLTEVSALRRCPPYGGVRLTEVSALRRCPPYGGVRLTEVSVLWRCPF